MSKKVRVGLIGCGKISQRHVSWFAAHPGCDIAVVCDAADEAAEACATSVRDIRPQAAVDTASDYWSVLERSDIDAVAVLLPHSLHYPVAKAALEAGKHVLVEKPMTTRSKDAEDLVETARQAKKRLVIGYQRSYLPEYVVVREKVKEGVFGQLKFITAHLEQSWFEYVRQMMDQRGWKTNPEEAGGGQLVDTGSHTLAAILDVTRLTPREVFAFVDNCGLKVDVDTAAVIRFAEGALASISIGGFGHSVTECIRIVGERASARIFFRTVREQTLEIDGEVVDAKSLVQASTPNANLIDAILGKGDISADGQLGWTVAELSEGIYESARTGTPVQLG